MLNKSDLELIEKMGKNANHVASQIDKFKSGFPDLNLVKPATIGDGILNIEEAKASSYIAEYNQSTAKTVKFVPASGAASRMFKELYAFVDKYDGSDEAYEKFVAEKGNVYKFFEQIESFAFYESLKSRFEEIHGYSLEEAHLKRHYTKILSTALDAEGLNYGASPKALIEFHAYGGDTRTASEEQLEEGKSYAQKEGKAAIHFTASPDHLNKFDEHVSDYAKKMEGIAFDLSFSTQKASTDTIAVTPDNLPYKYNDAFFFRPAGHGALLENLNDLDAELVFVKNIDNVVPDRMKADTKRYKELLAGVLLNYQEATFALLRKNDAGEDMVEEGASLLEKMGYRMSDPTKEQVLEKLNRPIRVCGMVKNEGEPGGGPFWVKNEQGHDALQIVESVQVNASDEKQLTILKSSTHFNPVDLVCGLKDYKGVKFDLLNYRDDMMGIITEKSHQGQTIKAMELPGLWNGSMANWNTIFVEVPVSTFNPVKTVFDLLRPVHQA